jgi:penicillin-binding protein 2
VNKNSFAKRYIVLIALFALLCLFYTIKLIGYELSLEEQITGRVYDGNTYEYTVSIPAKRGDICDRDGKILATAREAYSMTFNYWSMPGDVHENNRTLLVALDALEYMKSGEVELKFEPDYATDHFPFDGKYPNLTPKKTLSDENSKDYKTYKLVQKRREWEVDDPLKLIDKYIKKYALLSMKDGVRRYTNDEVDAILRIRYNMNAEDFGVYAPYVLCDSVPLEVVAYTRERNATGIDFPQSKQRQYNYPGYLSHILGGIGYITAENLEYYTDLGYPGDALVGLSGVEALFEEYLHGVDGSMKIVEDADGRIISKEVVKQPVPGKDVWLTIDIDLQVAAEDALAEFAKKYCKAEDAGAFTAIDPKDGGVLVLASYPTYDLTTFNANYDTLIADPSKPLTNRVLYGTYTPGSTFKLGMAVAALEEGLIDENSTVYCSGVYTRYSSYGLKCWVYPDAHGVIDVKEAITVSCNCFFCEMGYRLGIDKMNEYCRIYGLGEKTGIELGEATGILAGEANNMKNGLGNWYPGNTIAAAIGQSDNMFTPLQLSSYVSTLLNGGTRYNVHILDSVREYYTDDIIEKYTPYVVSSTPISSYSLAVVKEGMRSMIYNSYTASTYMKNIPVTVGGKSGTAQTNAANDNGLFVAAAPYNDPQIVISAVLEGGASGLYCSGIAAAVFEEFYGVNDGEAEE